MSTRTVLLFLLVLVGGGCAVHTNPHGYQVLPHVVRIDTVPAGAEVVFPRWHLVLAGPCDVERPVSPDDELVVRKEGYRPWRGRLRDLPRVARNTYRIVLAPVLRP